MKTRLTSDERGALLDVARSLVDPRKMSAVCAYGSKVAGYARVDSDYDLIVVSKRFGEGVRYKYIEEPLAASALIVDEEMLLDDARTAALGEFVAGRFLNIYESLLGAELLSRVEVDYKRRIIGEALYELTSDYGEFSLDLIIPYEYFLFDKLHKRALVYPPALYSYVHTYAGKSGDENRHFALEGFREAASGLQARRFLSIDESSIRIVSEKLKGDAFTKVFSLFSLTARGVTQYAVHGYAGRVGLGVFKKEAFSKLKRMRERPEPPLHLEKPRRLLRLREGVVFGEGPGLYEEIAGLSGLGGGFKVAERSAGDVYTTTRIISLSGNNERATFVLKHFSDVRSLKWALLGIWAYPARKFSLAPLSRLHREYSASLRLREEGIRTPEIIGVAPEERTLVKEYVEGQALSGLVDRLMKGSSDDTRSVAAYARTLARVHRAGFTLGDAKASNAFLSDGEVILTDLEQALEGGDVAWDVAEFLYYTAKLSLKGARMEVVARAFLAAYRDENGPDAIRRAMSLRYAAPFRPFLAPSMSRLIRDLLEEYSR